MKCPLCGVDSHVLDSRQRGDVLKRRRECFNEHRFATVEVFTTAVNSGHLQRSIATAVRNRKLYWRNQKIVRDQRTAAEIGRDHGLSLRTIHTIRRRTKAARKTL